LVPALLAAAALLLLLPQTQDYVQHFVEGLRFQDLATLMRLGEYKDALILISRYPWIGVGFVGTPEASLYIGVSNVYLLIAEEMGLIGLSAFLLVLVVFFRQVWLAWPQLRRSNGTAAPDDAQSGLEAILLGLTAALAGILVAGLLDHYFFNLAFPHSVAIFWLYIGLAMVTVRLGTGLQGSSRTEP
jgi:O-antigen ligase